MNVLEAEIKILQSKKSGILAGLDAARKEAGKAKQEALKEVEKERQALKVEIAQAKKEIKSEQEKLIKREEQIAKREVESDIINLQVKQLANDKKEFEQVKTQTEKAKSSYLEAENKANLKAKQYEKLIQELKDKLSKLPKGSK